MASLWIFCCKRVSFNVRNFVKIAEIAASGLKILEIFYLN